MTAVTDEMTKWCPPCWTWLERFAKGLFKFL